MSDSPILPPRIKDITSQRFGRLVAIRFIGKGKPHVRWLFRCDCGNTIVTTGNHVRSGHTQSCGCWKREKSRENVLKNQHTWIKHGDARTGKHHPIYTTWWCMKMRCENTIRKDYPYYGGRGIKVLWKSYEDFKRDMLPGWQAGLSIDRIDPNGHYCKENC